MLGAIDIRYLPQAAVKGQVLVDQVAEFIKEVDQVGSKGVRIPEESLRVNMISSCWTWDLFVDKASNQKDEGVGIVIISQEGFTLEKSLRLSVSATNNEAKYEALQGGLVAV